MQIKNYTGEKPPEKFNEFMDPNIKIPIIVSEKKKLNKDSAENVHLVYRGFNDAKTLYCCFKSCGAAVNPRIRCSRKNCNTVTCVNCINRRVTNEGKIIYGDHKVFLSGEVPFTCPKCNGNHDHTYSSRPKKRSISEIDTPVATRSTRSKHKIIIDSSDEDEEDYLFDYDEITNGNERKGSKLKKDTRVRVQSSLALAQFILSSIAVDDTLFAKDDEFVDLFCKPIEVTQLKRGFRLRDTRDIVDKDVNESEESNTFYNKPYKVKIKPRQVL
ncbi:hypothetical protein AKO1_013959 [Acrasis kona]|uniref:Zinc-finger domain-containing protein n=1 Tax=Acrasis kona TaxID=1008807 RepID=A0AAW2Z1N6_9EUKA